ncbi:hypothetical protein [Odoribacter lunatus]|uniref:hypothetical protein n=1 Tax=Odoribacter lunatus TaxID=2941335 RepID=UPI0020409524|nr:hypothetical protein [Odoribacter lunatus]
MTEKILKIVTIAMFAITVVILGFFIFGGEVPDQIYTTPVYTAPLLNWAYTLFIIAVISALIFPIVRLFTRPKQAVRSFMGLAVLVVVVLIAYAMADGTPMNIIGYTGPDNVPSRLIFSDTIIYTMYILFGGAIISIIATEFLRKIR